MTSAYEPAEIRASVSFQLLVEGAPMPEFVVANGW